MFMFVLVVLYSGCNKDQDVQEAYPAIEATFGNRIDPNNLIDYAGQNVPAYIGKDAARTNPIKNPQAMLGRVRNEGGRE